MKIVILASILLSACIGDNDVQVNADAAVDVSPPRDCGEPPEAPYPTTLAYDNVAMTTTMSSDDWQSVVVFRDKILNWTTCVRR